jgi:hypothetical protein
MVVEKSDAMVQYDKGIGEILKTRPKRGRDVRMRPEAGDMIMGATVVIIVVAVALSIIH